MVHSEGSQSGYEAEQVQLVPSLTVPFYIQLCYIHFLVEHLKWWIIHPLLEMLYSKRYYLPILWLFSTVIIITGLTKPSSVVTNDWNSLISSKFQSPEHVYWQKMNRGFHFAMNVGPEYSNSLWISRCHRILIPV